ncbi:unnamed protein product [Clonostachys rosea]|uniref:Uncharacterized protein n=1 Tax=Bionectria ochroleuca TaxID=29856 RepID=A0ABY6U3E7_BIOOC|nr:unnamed protein product [Clonostachys rosea]
MKNTEPSPARSRPAWYYRVRSITSHGEYDGQPIIEPEDFDEDISDLEESDKEEEGHGYCDCDSDASECECELPVDDDVSERSYTGDDADYYYDLKEMREERKQVRGDSLYFGDVETRTGN